jgi:type I restriction enzyme S subunit
MVVSSINIKELTRGNGEILKPTFHLNTGKIRFMKAKNGGIKFKTLKSVTKSVYSGGIFKRMFVDKMEFGLPYISAQHMMSFNPIEDAKLISKKNTPRQEDMTLLQGQILVSCAGTIGNVRLVSKDLNGVIGSQDIIRVISDENTLSYRFIYAYLAAPTVYAYIQSFIYGSVVPRIDPKTFEQLPFPIFKNSIISYVNEKILNAEKFREKALTALKKAHNYFDNRIKYNQGSVIRSVTFDYLSQFQSRLDASFNVRFREITNLIKKSAVKYEPLNNYIKDAFIPNRGKRIYTKKGLKYLSSSDIFLSNPVLIEKFISLNTPKISSMVVKKGWILVARSGQEILGSTQIVGNSLNGLGVNEHGLRLIINTNDSYYVFAFLSSHIGNQYLRAGIFGSAILTIEDSYIKEMLLPILQNKEIVEVNELIKTYVEFYDKAIQEETEAVNKIEQEIELWQK